VRITFSFLDGGVGILSIVPPQNAPGVSVINDLAYAVQRNLPECRRLWWMYQLQNPENQAAGPCCLLNQTRAGSLIVDATYDPATCMTSIRFEDGSAMKVVV